MLIKLPKTISFTRLSFNQFEDGCIFGISILEAYGFVQISSAKNLLRAYVWLGWRYRVIKTFMFRPMAYT